MKKISAAIGSLGLLAYSALPAFAQGEIINPCEGTGQFTQLCDLSAEDIGPVVQAIVTVLLIIAVLIALFYLIWGGIRWITSGGDKGKVDEARKHIVAAIIGLIVAFLAYFILQLILGFFNLSLTTLELPTVL